jgi:hypothetical protein
MPSIDLSRSAHQPAKRYTTVRWQQGRVFTDDDLNESESITSHERAESLVDVIGPSGTSDDALLVSGVVDVGGEVDFQLGSGTIYVGGRRVRVPSGQRYRQQDDFFDPPVVAVPAGERHDLVWCEVVEVPVTAVEDAELREVGLGGPDTSARTRLVWQVHVETGVDDDCEAAWVATVGADVDERGMVQTDARLTVGFVPGSTPDDLCTPAVTGGYLTHLNQAIRVQCIDDAHITWGFDNASSLYRVDLAADDVTVQFHNTPHDEAHRPRAGQVVELLPWSSVLSNGEKQAASSGVLAVVGESYDPDLDRIVLTAPVGAFGQDAWQGRDDAVDLAAGGEYVFLRVWDRGDDTSAPALGFDTLGTPVALGTTGLEVSFTGTTFRRGDHWIIAARPAEPDQVVPWDFTEGRAPHGPVRLRAPLGIVHWEAGTATVKDCRRRFRSLTELRGCCEITVGDGSHTFGDVTSIQAAVDLLPPEGGRVCVRAGRYDERVVIVNRTFVEISGCGPDTIIAPTDGDGPVISVEGSTRVALSTMQVVALDDEAIRVGAEAACAEVRVEHVVVSASPTSAGIYVLSPAPHKEPTVDVVIRSCTIEARNLEAPPEEGEVVELWPAVFVQAVDVEIVDSTVTANDSRLTGALGGVQIGGLSQRVSLRRNTIIGGSGHGVTIGSLVWVPTTDLSVAVSDYQAFVAMVVVQGWFVWFDGGCIQVDGEPRPDPEDDTPRFTPLSAGPVFQLVVEDCHISDMAGDGIGIARFFDPRDDETSDIIELEHARIDRNHIFGNRRTPRGAVPPRLARLSGQGGVVLAHVHDLRLRDNRIMANGATQRDPVCGVFVLHGEALLMTGNDIADNGAVPDREGPTRIGTRGGIVVRSCRGASVGIQEWLQAPEIAALVVHGNRVSQPVGQALWVQGVGQMLIHDNQLSAGSLAIHDIFSAILALIDLDSDRDVRDLGEVATMVVLHLLGMAVTVINTGFPIDLLNGRLGPIRDKSPGFGRVAMMASYLGTEAGQSAFEQSVEEEAAVKERVSLVDDTRPKRGLVDRLLQSGQVSFTDNQVTLDLVDQPIGFGLCSVLLLTIDDLNLHDNQVRCMTARDLVLVNVIAVGLWTVRCQGNRFQENRLGSNETVGLGTLFSAAVWGCMNTTTGNQTSGYLLAAALSSALVVDGHNQSWA